MPSRLFGAAGLFLLLVAGAEPAPGWGGDALSGFFPSPGGAAYTPDTFGPQTAGLLPWASGNSSWVYVSARQGNDQTGNGTATGPWRSLGRAVNAAAPNIILMPGTYSGVNNTGLSLRTSTTIVAGRDPDAVAAGWGDTGGSQRGVAGAGLQQDLDVTLDCGGRSGLRLISGNFSLTGLLVTHCVLALAVIDSNVTIANCFLTENYGPVAANASVLWASNSSVSLRRCQVTDNGNPLRSGPAAAVAEVLRSVLRSALGVPNSMGAISLAGSKATVASSVFLRNAGQGSAIAVSASSAVVTGSELSGNANPALLCAGTRCDDGSCGIDMQDDCKMDDNVQADCSGRCNVTVETEPGNSIDICAGGTPPEKKPKGRDAVGMAASITIAVALILGALGGLFWRKAAYAMSPRTGYEALEQQSGSAAPAEHGVVESA